MGKFFRIFEVFRIGSALVHSPKKFKEAVCVKTFTTEFIDNLVTFGLQFFSEQRVIFGDFGLIYIALVEKMNAFLLVTGGNLSARESRSSWCFHHIS